MRIIFGFILTLIILTIFRKSYKANNDIFSPLCFFSLIQFIRYVPGIVYFDVHMNIELNIQNTFLVFIMEIVVIFFTWLGSKLYKEKSGNSNIKYIVKYRKGSNLLFLGLFLYIIGFIAMTYYIMLCGGVTKIINNVQLDYSSGRGYLLSLSKLMVIGMLCLVEKLNKHKFILFILFVIYSSTIIIFTKRSPIIEALMILVFAYNYRVERFRIRKLLNLKVIFIAFLLGMFIVIMPTIRNPIGYNTYTSLSEMITVALNNYYRIMEELSYTSRDAFVYTHFNIYNFWYGRSLINLLCAPLPRSIFPWKPPVDDGIYLANYVYGYYLIPPTNVYIIRNSYPFSTQGSMFANFGIVGVIVASLFMGYLYEHTYKILKDTDYDIVMIFIYQHIIYQLELSSLSIVQALVPILMIIISFKIFSGYKLIKINERDIRATKLGISRYNCKLIKKSIKSL